MAQRELQGRLQLAEQQVRMYREAMEHLMAAPATSSPTSQSLQAVRPASAPATAAARGSILALSGESKAAAAAGGTGTRRMTEPGSGVAGSFFGECAGSTRQTRGLSDTGAGGAGGVEAEGGGSRTDSLDAPRGAIPPGRAGNVWDVIGGVAGRIGERTAAGWMALSGAGGREDQRLLIEAGKLRKRRAAVWRERQLLAQTRAELARCRTDLLSRQVAVESRRSDLAEARQNCRNRRALYTDQLVSAMRMGALNDCFHIWHQGPFATINGFRVGRLNAHVVDWQEVNAGVGQAAIVLVTVAMAMGVEFSKYLVAPCGSFTKIARSEDGRVLYSLHTDESFSLFPRRNFNFALKAFLHCLGEVGDHVQDHDPTLRLPYHIKEKDGTVGGLPVALGSSYEDWTRALKYMLTDLKWIAAWAAKYIPPC